MANTDHLCSIIRQPIPSCKTGYFGLRGKYFWLIFFLTSIIKLQLPQYPVRWRLGWVKKILTLYLHCILLRTTVFIMYSYAAPDWTPVFKLNPYSSTKRYNQRGHTGYHVECT